MPASPSSLPPRVVPSCEFVARCSGSDGGALRCPVRSVFSVVSEEQELPMLMLFVLVAFAFPPALSGVGVVRALRDGGLAGAAGRLDGGFGAAVGAGGAAAAAAVAAASVRAVVDGGSVAADRPLLLGFTGRLERSRGASSVVVAGAGAETGDVVTADAELRRTAVAVVAVVAVGVDDFSLDFAAVALDEEDFMTGI